MWFRGTRNMPTKDLMDRSNMSTRPKSTRTNTAIATINNSTTRVTTVIRVTANSSNNNSIITSIKTMVTMTKATTTTRTTTSTKTMVTADTTGEMTCGDCMAATATTLTAAKTAMATATATGFDCFLSSYIEPPSITEYRAAISNLCV